MRDQRSALDVEREAEPRRAPSDPAANVNSEACLGIAAVVADADLQLRRQAAAAAQLVRALAFHAQAPPAERGIMDFTSSPTWPGLASRFFHLPFYTLRPPAPSIA